MGGKVSSLPNSARPPTPAGVAPLQIDGAGAKDATQPRSAADDTIAPLVSAKGAAPATATATAATAKQLPAALSAQSAAPAAQPSNLIPIATAPLASAAAAAAAAAASPAAALVLSTGPSASRDSRDRFDALLDDRFPRDLRLVGLENYGNTCYCNSVLQSLYNCTHFRREVLAWFDARTTSAAKKRLAAAGKDLSVTSPLLYALGSLFKALSLHKPRSGVFGPKDFVTRMKAVAPQFQTTQHQDAQEFLIMILNGCSDERRREMKEEAREELAMQQAAAAEAAAKAAKKSKSGGDKKKPSIHAQLQAEDQTASNGKALLPSLSIPHNNGLASGSSSSLGFDSLPSMLAQVPLSPADPMLPPTFQPNATAPSASLPPLETPQPSILLQSILAMPAASLHVASLTATAAAPAPATPTADSPSSAAATTAASSPSAATAPTFIQSVFEGTLLNLTSCLSCGRRSLRTEPFFDLSLEVLPDSSLSSLLRNFSKEEVMDCAEKYACSTCLLKQEAHKSMHVFSFPPTLIVHLKRFRFQETNQTMQKLSQRVTFPMQIRLKGENGGTQSDTATAAAATAGGVGVAEETSAEKLYELTSVVVHIGSSLRHGHYVSLCKVSNQWVCYDDDDLHLWTVEDVKTVYGSVHTGEKNGHLDGYLLFYSVVAE